MDDTHHDGPPAGDSEPLFRTSKKRKFYRQRARDEETSQLPSAETITQPSLDVASNSRTIESTELPAVDSDGGETNLSMAEVLRRRKQRKARIGVEFRSEPSIFDDRNETSMVDAQTGTVSSRMMAPESVGRFAKQAGLAGNVDKHMMAYIDSELAKRHQVSTATADIKDTKLIHEGSFLAGQDTSQRDEEAIDSSRLTDEKQRQPATLGKIQEISLDALDETDTSKPGPKTTMVKKVRLGPDGKPWRTRKRRASDDIKRDSIVDQVLRENRIDMYEEPVVQTTNTTANGENDDRLAEEFRKEYLDSVSSRQKKKAAPPPTRGLGGKVEEELKGPKLGGSRSARAKMHAELKVQRK